MKSAHRAKKSNSSSTDDIWTAPIWVEGSRTEALSAAEFAENTDDPQKEEIPWDEASDYVGEAVTVTGRIIRSFNFQDKSVFFNFDQDYENTLTLVILHSDFDSFGGKAGIEALQNRLTNKVIRVRGNISLYMDERLQLRLTSPDQILSAVDIEAD